MSLAVKCKKKGLTPFIPFSCVRVREGVTGQTTLGKVAAPRLPTTSSAAGCSPPNRHRPKAFLQLVADSSRHEEHGPCSL